MGQRGFATKLPKDLRTELDRLIAEGGLSVDEVWSWLRARDVDVGRSSVHRHMVSVEEVSKHMREAREASAAIVRELGPDAAEGDTGRLLTEVVQTIAFKVASRTMSDGDILDMEELSFLAKSVKDISSARKTDTDRVLKVRQETAKAAAGAAEKVAKARGISGETVDAIKHAVLGVAS